MGCGDSTGQTNNTSDFTQATSFNPASAEETALRQSLGSLGTEQQNALISLLKQTQGGSMLSLSPADQAQLDQAYNAAHLQLNNDSKMYSDYLSGGRGMRMSDTPIAQQAINQYALGDAQISSNRAQAGLNLGLQANQLRANSILGGASALPSGTVAAFNPLFQERIASGTTHTTGNTSGTTINTPSLMSQIQQGIGIAGSIGSMGAGYMSGLPSSTPTSTSTLGLPSSPSFFGPGN